MKPAISLLQKALYELKHLHNHTFQVVTKESGVHNLQKIVSGEIEPTANSWWKLHRAYPEYIPEPVYEDGAKVYKNVIADKISKSNVSTGNMEITNNRHASDLSPEEQTLINLFRKKDTRGKILERIIADLIMRETEDDKVI